VAEKDIKSNVKKSSFSYANRKLMEIKSMLVNDALISMLLYGLQQESRYNHPTNKWLKNCFCLVQIIQANSRLQTQSSVVMTVI
jgi:hypothetical protein